MALVVKNPPASAGEARDMGLIPGSGRSPGGGNGNPLWYSCWETPWTEEPGGLQFMGLQRVGHDWSDLAGAADVIKSKISYILMTLLREWEDKT